MIPFFLQSQISEAVINSLSPAAWFRYGVGITVTGAGVSTWADQSGNGRDLLQGTDTNRPALQADNSILFDGTDNFLATNEFTLNQPETVYLLMKSVTYTASDRFMDGKSALSMMMDQGVSDGDLRLYAGSFIGPVVLSTGIYGVVCGVYNGASSLIQVNHGTPATGNAGAANAGGFTLGHGPLSTFANIQVKEVIIFAAAHDSDTRSRVIRYLQQVGNS